MSAIALATDRSDIIAVPLENPRQTAAYDYSTTTVPQSPKFSRAMALSCGEYATIFISGTASITDSETRHVGDAAAQTHETLDNIAALISEENLPPPRPARPGHLAGRHRPGPRLRQAAGRLRQGPRSLRRAAAANCP